MKSLTVIILAFFLSSDPPQKEQSNIPEDYQLLYEQDFSSKKAMKDFEMTDPRAWRMEEGKYGMALELYGKSDYKPKVRSPLNIAMIKDKMFGSFIMEADVRQTGREYGHRDMCFFFNIKDPSNFYYVHMASKPDPHAHNIFLVNDEPRVAIAEKVSGGVDWGDTDTWHKVRIARDVQEGTIKVYFNDMETPVMEGKDTHFDYGHIGFGSFDDTGMIDNIKIWAPALVEKGEGFFSSASR
ncbi:MAG: hypothetical protein ACLFUB_18585 [Cyclobacteriaceae bacterium]